MKQKLSVLLFILIAIGSTHTFAADPTLSQVMDLAYNAQFSEGEVLASSYISSHPQDPVGYLVRGNLLDWKQQILNLRGSIDSQIIDDFETANLLAFNQWDKDQASVDKMVNLGNSYLFLSKKWLDLKKKARAGLILKKCQKHMDEAIKRDPNRFDAYLAIGVFNFYSANLPPGLGFLAGLLGLSGNEPLGLSQLEKASSNPSWLQSHAAFILTYAYGQTKKNYPLAEKYLDQLHAQYPDNPHFLFLKGEYAQRAKLYDKSRQNFAEFFSFCDTHPNKCVQNYLFLANYFLGTGYGQEKKFAEAKPYLQKAMDLDVKQYLDRESFLFYHWGLVLKAEGKKEEARGFFQKSIDAPSGNPEAKELAHKEL